jgi:hypothetical protein
MLCRLFTDKTQAVGYIECLGQSCSLLHLFYDALSYFIPWQVAPAYNQSKRSILVQLDYSVEYHQFLWISVSYLPL